MALFSFFSPSACFYEYFCPSLLLVFLLFFPFTLPGYASVKPYIVSVMELHFGVLVIWRQAAASRVTHPEALRVVALIFVCTRRRCLYVCTCTYIKHQLHHILRRRTFTCQFFISLFLCASFFVVIFLF